MAPLIVEDVDSGTSGYHTFGAGAADVTTDAAGNAVGGIQLTIWDAEVGGTQITDLLDVAGNPLPGYVTSSSDAADIGRLRFQAPASYSVVYGDRGYGDRFVFTARESLTRIGTAIAKADQAFTDSAKAVNDSTTALTKATTAETRADEALTTADEAYRIAAAVGGTPVPNVADLAAGTVVAHRGGVLVAPEGSMAAYRAAFAAGRTVLDADVRRLADGSLAVMHDATTNRTTTRNSDVAKHTAATWRSLTINATALLGGGNWWPNNEPPPLLDDLLAEFGNKQILSLELKETGAVPALVAALEARGVQKSSVLVSSFNLDTCTAAAAAGLPACKLGTPDVVAAANAGCTWIGTTLAEATSQVVADAHAAGIKVGAYTLIRRWQHDQAIAAGVDLVWADDPDYLTGFSSKTDMFVARSWTPGMLPNIGSRGIFRSDGSFGYDSDGTNNRHFTQQGYLTPTDPASFTLDLEIKNEEALAGLRWAAVFLGTSDIPFIDAAQPGCNGYSFTAQDNGGMAVWRVDDGISTMVASVPDPGEVNAGIWRPYRITVTPTQITWQRTDLARSAVTADVAHRPIPFVAIGKSGVKTSFRNLTIT